MDFRCFVAAAFVLNGLLAEAVHIIWDNNAVYDPEASEEFGRSDEARMPNWFFIFPGTKWCGAGDIAENEDDLGTYADTDKCCRAHDHCDEVIEGHQTNHNLTNPSFYSRLSCECDDQFRKCLKNVSSRVSTQVGHLYFTALGTKCYREDYPVTGCKKYSYLPTRKCLEYEYDTSGEKMYQWFDVPNY